MTEEQRNQISRQLHAAYYLITPEHVPELEEAAAALMTLQMELEAEQREHANTDKALSDTLVTLRQWQDRTCATCKHSYQNTTTRWCEHPGLHIGPFACEVVGNLCGRWQPREETPNGR